MKLKKNQPLYRQLEEKLEDYIRQERPVLLPTEREIMDEYGVSRKTVRSAVAEMIKSGSVTPVRGKGTVVNPAAATRIAPPVILIDSYETIPAYEYEIYLAVKQCLNNNGILPSVHLIDPHAEPVTDQLKLIAASRRILLFSAICNQPAAWEYFRNRTDDILCVGFKPAQPFRYCASDLHDGFIKSAHALIAAGHRRIALIGLERDQERFSAFMEAHRESGISFDPRLHIDASGTRHDGYQAINRLLEQKAPFTAVLAHNDLCALGVMEGLLQRGVRIPENISLAGCDNLADAKFFPVPLTTVAHQHDIYAQIALDFLNGSTHPKEAEDIPMQLIQRQSIKEISPCEQ